MTLNIMIIVIDSLSAAVLYFVLVAAVLGNII
jgi:hypothetical protein